MSNLPPINPYDPAIASAPDVPIGGPMSGFTKFLLIVFIIFGVLGVSGGLWAIAQSAINLAINAGSVDDSASHGEADSGTPTPFKLSKTTELTLLGFNVLSFIASIVMLVGGAIGLKQKRLGLDLVRWCSLYWIIHKVIETATLYSMSTEMFEGFRSSFMAEIEKQQEAPEVDFNAILNGIFVGMMVFMAVYTLAIMLFYLISFLHTSKASVRAKFPH
jgi:hypothetical protein